MATGAGAGAGATVSVARTNVSLLRMHPGAYSRSAWIQRKTGRYDRRSGASCARIRRKAPLGAVHCCPRRLSGGDPHPHRARKVAVQRPRAAERRPERSTARRACRRPRVCTPARRTAPPSFAVAGCTAVGKFASLYFVLTLVLALTRAEGLEPW